MPWPEGYGVTGSSIKDGHVTLEGEVAWNFQRDAVENAVRHLSGKVRSWAERDEAQQTAWAVPGVTRVTNNITVGS